MLISVLQGDWFLADFVCIYDASALVISISSHYTLAVKLMSDPIILILVCIKPIEKLCNGNC